MRPEEMSLEELLKAQKREGALGPNIVPEMARRLRKLSEYLEQKWEWGDDPSYFVVRDILDGKQG